MGRFALLRLVGEGGMGQVHAAYDERLDRRVALKVIHADRTNSPIARERLLREARAMARLSHPNVVQLYEGGEQDDQAFLVLEFVDGPTLEAWLEEERSTREVLSAFSAIGRGLAAAHAVGVVHRDFKPANVLFAADGIPKVADFGLASFGEAAELPSGEDDRSVHREGESRLTKTGHIAGTPLFMSPEQWRGESSDARSDQFSYCLALYRALYGEDPFSAETMEVRRETVLRGEPKPPDGSSATPRWLWAPVRKGLSLDPNDRFESMDALLEALAADPSRKRRRTAFISFGAVVAIGAASYVPVRDWRETQRCEAESQQIFAHWGADERTVAAAGVAKIELPYVQTSWALASDAIDRFTVAWQQSRFEGCIAAHVDGTMSPTLVPRSEECFEDLRERFELSAALFAQPNRELMDQAAAMFTRLPDPAECARTAHLAQRPELPDDAVVHAEVRRLRREARAVGILSARGEIKEAIARGEELIAEAEAVGWPPLVALVHSVMGDVYNFARDGESAAASFRRTYEIATAAGDDLAALQGIVGLMFALTEMLNRPKEALWWYDVAKPTIARIGLTNHPDIALAWRGYGAAHQALGNFDEALAAYQQAHAGMVASFGEGSSTAVVMLGDLGIAHYNLKNYEAALQSFEKQYAAIVASRGAEHPDVVDALVNLGAAQSDLGRLDLSHERYVEALRILEAAYGPDDIRSSWLHNNIGAVLLERGELASAKASVERALALRIEYFGDAHPVVASCQYNLGEIEAKKGNAEAALALFDQAHTIFAKNDPTGERAQEALEGQLDAQRALGNVEAASELANQLEKLRSDAREP